MILKNDTRILFKSERQDWKTPENLYKKLNKEFKFNFDPCPTGHPELLPDGLNIEWGDSNFVNPPYKEIAKWIKKGFEEWKKGKTVVFLIPSRTCTRWWHAYCMNATEIRFIKGRLKFQGAKYNAPFPSCIVVFKGNHSREG